MWTATMNMIGNAWGREEVLNAYFKSLQIIDNIFYPVSHYQTQLPSVGSREGQQIKTVTNVSYCMCWEDGGLLM